MVGRSHSKNQLSTLEHPLRRDAVFHFTRPWTILLFFMAVCGLTVIPVSAQDGALPAMPPPITTIPSDGFNMKVVEQVSPYYVITTLDPPVFNWFAGTFTNLPTDKEVTIGLNMNGMDITGGKADVSKWVGLKPVMTYGDPTKYETYEWFQKDAQGRWVSGDPLKQDDDKYAGTGKTPIQKAIPEELAKEFLSLDGTYWQPWREVETADAVTTLNIFRIRQRYSMPTVTIAMHIPYTYSFQQELIRRLQLARFPGVSIDVIGVTPTFRRLQVIRIDDPSYKTEFTIGEIKHGTTVRFEPCFIMRDPAGIPIPDSYKVILIIAREHGSEPTSSWVVYGSICKLLEDTPEARQLRKNTTWLLLPIEDVDGSIYSCYEGLTVYFRPEEQLDPRYGAKLPIEVGAYMRYLRGFTNFKFPIAAAVSLHNIECNEGGHFFSPFITAIDQDIIRSFNRNIFSALKVKEFNTDTGYGQTCGSMSSRLFGWCGLQFGSLCLMFETNDRFPAHRLTNREVQSMGQILVKQLSIFFHNPMGIVRLQAVHEKLVSTY